MKLLIFLYVLTSINSCLSQRTDCDIVPRQPYNKCLYQTNEDTITFYISETTEENALPLILYIQGSGKSSLFTKSDDGTIVPEYGHMTWFDVVQNRFRILLIEKPGINYLQSGDSNRFDSLFSLENWSDRVVKTLDYVFESENVDTNNVMIVGHSEGGIVASRVANKMGERISNVAILAGEGPSQLYSLFKFADDGTFFNSESYNLNSSEERLRYLNETWTAILNEPKSTEKKFWGYTYLRWSSMLQTSVIEELENYNGQIFIVQGGNDKAVHPETAFISYTSLLSKGKNVKLKFIEKADHSFHFNEDPQIDGWKMVIENVIDWFAD